MNVGSEPLWRIVVEEQKKARSKDNKTGIFQ
jgi:hypothetical protein